MGGYSCEIGEKEYCFFRELISPEIVASRDISQILIRRRMQKVLEDLSDGCWINCAQKKIASMTYNERMLVQLRCLVDHRYILGDREKRKISSEEVGVRWVEEGFAKVFAKVFAKKKLNNEVRNHWPMYCEAEAMVNRH
ncbi:hypothetical protein KAJ38_03075 [Candidatus Pacearchaeota archaeon]|nr:hypothetical protein [Candidatus Pacearchaeota archaeon]